jgi:ABC-type multidrug transport system fused ATPase/permease subunit
MIANLEMSMNAVERIEEYSKIEQEPAAITINRPPPLWPEHGEITVTNLSLRYDTNSENVIKNISFKIKSFEKVGIVGRTGAGKSSLLLAFFRILNSWEGQIVIDGIDISIIGLKDLRSKL